MTEQFGNESIEDVSAAFDLLQNARRRGVLYIVKRNGRTSVEEVANVVSAWRSEHGDTTTTTFDVKTSLVHSHLPRLDEADVIDYDRESGHVELGERADDLTPFLQCTREHEPDLFRAARRSELERVSEIL